MFSSDAVRNGDVAELMGRTLDMVEGFISDMLSESSYLEAPTIVEDSNETTNENKMGELKPAAVDENNNDDVKQAKTGLEPNNILGAHVLEEKEEWFYQLADNYDVIYNSYTPTKRNDMGTHTYLPVTQVFSALPKPNITGNQKQEL